jgi:hypothetical protein
LLDLHQDVMHSFRSISLGTKLETAIQFDQNNYEQLVSFILRFFFDQKNTSVFSVEQDTVSFSSFFEDFSIQALVACCVFQTLDAHVQAPNCFLRFPGDILVETLKYHLIL